MMTFINKNHRLKMAVATIKYYNFSSVTTPIWPNTFESSVSKIRLQQQIKESNEECLRVLPRGQFMLYHRGKPLLYKGKDGSRIPKLVNYEQTAQLVPNIENEAAFMKLLDNDLPLFVAMIPKETNVDQIESSLDAKFIGTT